MKKKMSGHFVAQNLTVEYQTETSEQFSLIPDFQGFIECMLFGHNCGCVSCRPLSRRCVCVRGIQKPREEIGLLQQGKFVIGANGNTIFWILWCRHW